MSWTTLTRLGEAQILLPTALIASGWLVWRLGAHATARAWLALLGLAIAVTALSKLAFLGWGIGSSSLNFTGVSGHAMFAAAVYPMLARIATANAPPALQRVAMALGVSLALVIAVSRLEVQAHSASEVISGTLLGLIASGLALRWRPISPAPARPWGPMLLASGLVFAPWHTPPSLTHQLVTQMAMTLSHRDHPFTRADLHRGLSSSISLPQPRLG